MSWASVIPKELYVKPLPLVALTGLDTKNNSVHKEIWDDFSIRNNQKFRYKLVDGDHEYPKVKNERPLEHYVPKGIFKTNWLNKHLNLVPSLVVIFFDLDWDELNWKEKQMECSTKVELVRHSLMERNTRIVLVLIQKNPIIPIDGDNLVVRERYLALCAACTIKNNYLFLLHAEHLHGYINKLEDDAFNEPTSTYYMLEIKAIKFKRDSLNKLPHQFLFVRLAMKIGFFQEMKADIAKAIDYYKQAYLSLLDIRFYDTNILEIKTVASMINFKLCQLYFEIRHPIDAIDQFRKHIDIFRAKQGSVELLFEHSAWLAKQFHVMGELFEEAIKKGTLAAVQWQHPGFYFHSAANHTIQRRVNFKDALTATQRSGQHQKSLSSSSSSGENHPSLPIESLNNLEFYGQRPWRQGQQSMEILDPQRERDGIQCLQEMELKVNLTPLITELFNQAITHFIKFSCDRMKQYLLVCMAEEYLFSKQYEESLKIYVKVLNDYNSEHWWPVLTSIMSNAIKCAYYEADILNYCLICTEIIGKSTLIPDNEKSLIQKNLLRVLNNEVPLAEYHKIQSSEEINSKWKAEFSKILTANGSGGSIGDIIHKIIPASVSSMVPFVECKVSFSSPIVNSNEYCELFVFVRVNCVDPIKFNKLYVRFNIPSYNQQCLINPNGDDNSMLAFRPNEIKVFHFKFLTQKQDFGKELEISSISLELGQREQRVLILHWKGDCKNALSIEQTTLSQFHSLNTISLAQFIRNDSENASVQDIPAKNLNWDSIQIAPSTKIVSRKGKVELKLEHRMPIFVDEYYAIRLTIDNQEDTKIEDLNLIVELYEENHPNIPATNKPYRLWIGNLEKSSTQTHRIKQLGTVESKQQCSETIYVQANDVANLNLIVKARYDVDVQVKMLNYQNGFVFKQFANLGQKMDDKTSDLVIEKEQQVRCGCVQEDVLRLDVMNPFRFDFKFFSTQMKTIKSVRIGEPFIVLCEIKNETPYTLLFKNSLLETSTNVASRASTRLDGNRRVDSFLKGERLKHREMANECFCLVINDLPAATAKPSSTPNRQLCPLGSYFIEWKRRNHDDENGDEDNDDDDDEDDDVDEEEKRSVELESDPMFVRTQIKLPEIYAEYFPFIIETQLPAFGQLEESLTITHRIRNKTSAQILDLECNLDENEHFSIGGNKMELIQIMPNDSTDYTYVAYPLQSGYCKLPQLHIKLNNNNNNNSGSNNNKQNSNEPAVAIGELGSVNGSSSITDWNNLDPIIQNMIPSQIFIMPEKRQIIS